MSIDTPTTGPRLELLPAVDVTEGRAVQLVRGEAGSGKTYGNPLDAALGWQRDGAEWLHLVDLDAAQAPGEGPARAGRVELGHHGAAVAQRHRAERAAASLRAARAEL